MLVGRLFLITRQIQSLVTQMTERRLDRPRTVHLPDEKSNILTNLWFAFPVRDHQASSFALMMNKMASHPPNQRYFSFRFPISNFAKNSYLRPVQWSSSSSIRYRYTGFGSGERGHWWKYCTNPRYRN